MKLNRLAVMLLASSATLLHAQDVKVNILTEFWYTQMLDNTLRNNPTVAAGAAKYYDGMSAGRFQENTFNIKRAEIYCNYKISDEWSGYIMFDPSLSPNTTATVSGTVLQDWVITYAPAKTGLVFKGGQMKMPTTYESTLMSARDILFFDRTQMSRLVGERRDRGVQGAFSFGDPKGFNNTLTLAISNGSTDDGSSGKTSVDNNAAKDYTFRYNGSFGAAHKYGVYYRTGQTNLKYATTAVVTLPAAWTAAGVNLQAVKDNADKTTTQGLFYAFDQKAFHFDFEYSTGLIGRRFPSMFVAATAPGREHLDQKFTGYALTGAYKMGQHQIALRYDMMNYNSGDNWYTATSPYLTATGDTTPKYTETTLGYNYTFVPNKFTYGKLKVDFINRSKNFLAATPGETSLAGGNSLVASIMVGF